MKKFIFLSFLSFLMLYIPSFIEARDGYPESSAGVVPPVEYGGLFFSTRAVSTSSQVVRGPLTVSAVCFSTSAPTVFVELRMSSLTVSIQAGNLDTVMRVYNSRFIHNPGTGTVSEAVASGCVPVNVYIPKNLIWDVSVGTLNHATLLYNRKSSLRD